MAQLNTLTSKEITNDNAETPELKFAMSSGYGITYKDVLFFIWFGPVDMRALDFTHDAIAHIRKNFPTFSVFVVITDGSTAPTREQRAQFAAVFQQHPPRAYATVLDINGFTATLIKTVMTAISTMSRNSDSFRTFSNTRDAATWLSTRSSLAPGRILALASSLPRRFQDIPAG
jgi:hypothetical protein